MEKKAVVDNTNSFGGFNTRVRSNARKFSNISVHIRNGIKIFIVILLGFITIESIAWFSAIKFAKKHSIYMDNGKIISPFKWRPVISFDEWYKENSSIIIRKPSGTDYRNKPIVIFGCSFAYGEKLKDNQTLEYKLSEYIKAPVYNRAFSGWGVQHMLWQLENEPMLDSIKDPEFIIYVFISDHFRRLNRYSDLFTFMSWEKTKISESLRYEEKDNNLVRRHDFIQLLRHTMIANMIMNIEDDKIWKKLNSDKEFTNKTLNLVKMELNESKKIANQKWPNAKFIILDYESWYDKNYPSPYADFWDEIKKDGFIYINARKEFNVGSSELKYRISNENLHPNELAWDTIVPQLAKKLKKLE